MSGRSHHQFVACYLFVFLIVATTAASAQGATAQNTSAEINPAFAPDKMETILYGVAYYPEHMPHDRHDTYVELSQKSVITVASLGDSSCVPLQPRDCAFQL